MRWRWTETKFKQNSFVSGLWTQIPIRIQYTPQKYQFDKLFVIFFFHLSRRCGVWSCQVCLSSGSRLDLRKPRESSSDDDIQVALSAKSKNYRVYMEIMGIIALYKYFLIKNIEKVWKKWWKFIDFPIFPNNLLKSINFEPFINIRIRPIRNVISIVATTAHRLQPTKKRTKSIQRW